MPYNPNTYHRDYASIPQIRIRARKRPCLGCHREFESAGIHNRICKTCKRNDHGFSEFSNPPFFVDEPVIISDLALT